jgi:ribonuclease D
MWPTSSRCGDAKDRLEWFEEDCARALTVELEPGLATIYQRTRGTGRLRGTQRAAALALLDWRENRARAANRPRRWIMKDEVLLDLAQLMPQTRADLGRISGLSPRTIGRFGAGLLAAIEKADTRRFKQLAEECTPAPRPDAHALKALQTRVAQIAKELGIEPEIIAARRDLVATVLDMPPPHVASGWRSAVLK